MIRVAVVAPQLVRARIVNALAAADVKVLGEADSVDEGRARFLFDSLDVVVMDATTFAAEFGSAQESPNGSGNSASAIAGMMSGDKLDIALYLDWGSLLARVERLSPREREVLNLIGIGLSNHAIASRLTLAECTVKTHVGRILAKLDVESRLQAGLVAMAYRLAAQPNVSS